MVTNGVTNTYLVFSLCFALVELEMGLAHAKQAHHH